MPNPDLHPVQHPIIRQQGMAEFLSQLLILAVVTGGAFWAFGFQPALLIALVLGFSLTAMNIVAGAVSTNVMLGEIRDQLREDRRRDINAT